MTHDDLCSGTTIILDGSCAECAAILRIRLDERRQLANAVAGAENVVRVVSDSVDTIASVARAVALAEAVVAVEDLLYGWGDMAPQTIDKIVAPIKRLGGAS